MQVDGNTDVEDNVDIDIEYLSEVENEYTSEEDTMDREYM